MSNSATAYPLCWPAGWKRETDRIEAKFTSYKQKLSIAQGVRRLVAELRRMGIDEESIIISTNIKPRIDGMPSGNANEPRDPGAAVYWKDKKTGMPLSMAIDLYDRVTDNLAALAATIKAMRAIERHGGAEILERAFQGFQALPEPEQWWKVLGFDLAPKTRQEAEDAYRSLAKTQHPDAGGDAGKFSRIASAIGQARRALS
jgi:hypothetical protein